MTVNGGAWKKVKGKGMGRKRFEWEGQEDGSISHDVGAVCERREPPALSEVSLATPVVSLLKSSTNGAVGKS